MASVGTVGGQETLARAAEPSDPTAASRASDPASSASLRRNWASEAGTSGRPLSWVSVRDSAALPAHRPRWANRPPRHRGRQRVQRTPLAGPAGVYRPRGSTPNRFAASRCVACPDSTARSRTSRSASRRRGFILDTNRLGHHQQPPGRSGTPAHGWGISDRIWFRDSDAMHPHRCRRKQLPSAGKPDCWFDGDFSV